MIHAGLYTRFRCYNCEIQSQASSEHLCIAMRRGMAQNWKHLVPDSLLLQHHIEGSSLAVR